MNYKVTLTVGRYTDVIISYYVSFTGEVSDLQLVDSGSYGDDDDEVDEEFMMGGYSTVDDLDEVRETVSGMNDDILSALDVADLCGYEDVSIDVVSAEQQVVAGMNYKVTINVKCVCPMKMETKYEAQNVLISYYVPLGDQVATNLQLEDEGEVIAMELESDDDDDEDAKFLRLFRLARIVGPALLAFVVCLCVGLCL